MNYQSIPTKEVANLIRSDLKKSFPETTFSVRSTLTKIDIDWQDGPTTSIVSAITDQYKGNHDPDDTDYCAPRYVERDGQEVRYESKFIMLNRRYSLGFYSAALKRFCDRNNLTTPQVLTNSQGEYPYLSDQDAYSTPPQLGGEFLIRAFREELSSMEAEQVQVMDKTGHQATYQLVEKYGIEFPSKPDADCRKLLHQQGLNWNGLKRRWEGVKTPELEQYFRNLLASQGNIQHHLWIDIVVKFPDKPDKEAREKLKDKGFTWFPPNESWQAEHTPEREKFIAEFVGSYQSSARLASTPETNQSKEKADKLRAIALGMQKQINQKLNPAISQQNYTARRSRIASGMRSEGYHLEKIQELLYGLADAIEENRCPSLLSKITNKAQVDSLLSGSWPDYEKGQWRDYNGHPERLAKLGINEANFNFWHQELLKLGSEEARRRAEKQREIERIRDLERSLINAKIPGYFPTPSQVVSRMLELADIKAGMTILEPSVGKGSIIDGIKDAHSDLFPSLKFVLCELSYTLRQILEAKGYKDVIDADFLTVNPVAVDRVIMNPPWGKDAKESAAEHIQHAYKFLKPGGRLVAICDEGCFFRSFKRDEEFRLWLRSQGAEDERLEPGAFLKSDVQTGVNCRIVVIDKPDEANSIAKFTRKTNSTKSLGRSIPDSIKAILLEALMDDVDI
jgi:hypothetical protein